MSSGDKKEPKDERTSLSYMSWHMKELVAEIKILNTQLASIVASLNMKGMQNTNVKSDDVPF